MTVGIIGAMDEEVAILLEKMTNKQEETIANCLFIKGTLNEKDVVLLKSGIGKVNAALATTILHERYHPVYVINTGSAGGFGEDRNIGDIVISDQVVHHDVDVTAFGYELGQVPGMPPTFKADQQLIETTKKAVENLGLPAVIGTIATGDTFLADPEHVKFIRSQIPNIIAGEMEAAAVAQICHQYGTPFVIIRALSDIAGKESTISFDQFLETAAKNASAIIMNMIG